MKTVAAAMMLAASLTVVAPAAAFADDPPPASCDSTACAMTKLPFRFLTATNARFRA
jgi:hypothetical protein